MNKPLGNLAKKVSFATLLILGIQIQACAIPKEATSHCSASKSWFADTVHAPKEGESSPFATEYNNGKGPSNCDFHQWAWHKFLYLTQKDKATNDLVMFGPDYHQVDNKMMPYFSPWDGSVSPVKIELQKHLVLEDTGQADGTVLNSKQGFGPIYYSIHVNKTFINSAQKAINNQDENGVRVEDKFDVGSVELKAAWINVTFLEGYYSQREIKNKFYLRSGLIENDSIRGGIQKFALLGIHVVGIVENHPEFVWATFEHQALAPDYFNGPLETPKYYDKRREVSASRKYLLYKAGTPGSDVDLVHVKGKTVDNTFRMFKYGVPSGLPYQSTDKNLSASPDQQAQDKTNLRNIEVLNRGVKKRLMRHKSVWHNYFYSGAIWLDTTDYKFKGGIGSDIVGAHANKALRGSLALANITMETTFQTDPEQDPNKSADKMVPMHCFSCHNIEPNQSTMLTSHIFSNLLQGYPKPIK